MAEFSSITAISRELQGLTLTGVKRVDNQPLGKGSYGQVFAVKHGRETYAAKQIHSILVEAVSPEEKRIVRDNFLKECHHCKNLDHPNIVRFIGVYYPDPHSILPAMVMELMDTSLTEYVIKTPNISMKLKVSILHDISQGLSFLHCRVSPVIHRDLSPNNILLSRDSVAKISDLGVAKVVKAGTKGTQSKLTKAPGTTDFMPPEALADNPIYSTGLDIFSYGGLILHVVNQVWPAPTNLTAFDPKLRQVKGFTEVERRQKYLDRITAEAEVLKSLVIRCLDNDPAKRPTAANVLEMLKGLKIQGCEVISYSERMSSVAMGNTAMALSDTFMLLVDRIGYKSSKSWYSRGSSEEHVHRGTLLVGLIEAEAKETKKYYSPTLNYKTLSSENVVQLYCKPEDVYPLTLQHKGFLMGIKSAFDQYRMSKCLQLAGNLAVGDGIHVNIKSIPSLVKGIIRYIGNLPGEDGTKFGVEMLEKRGGGTSDGTFKNTFYFKCDYDCAVFVSLDKLVLPLAENSQNHDLDIHLPPPMLDGELKLGDRVTVFNENEKQLTGTVRWFGGCKGSQLIHKVVGIETDEKAFSQIIPGSFPGLNHFFIPKFNPSHQVFLPTAMILKCDTTDTPDAAKQKAPYYLRSQSSCVDPEVTIGTKLAIDASKKNDFLSGKHKAWDSIKGDLKKQEELAKRREAEDRQRRQQKAQEELNLRDILNATYNEPPLTVPQSRSTVSDYQYDQQLRHGMSVEENQKEALKKIEQRKEEARREKEIIESNERRHQMKQIKGQLQIGEIEGFDDTMLDPKRQEKIMEDLKRQNKANQQNSSQTGKPYNESPPTVSQSQSTVSDYQYDQQLHNKHQMVHQDPYAQGMHPQDVHSQGMYQPGMPQPGMPPPGMPQGMHPQDVHSQGMFQPHISQQGIYSQGAYSQDTPQQGMYLPSQGSNMSSQYVPPQGILLHGMSEQDIRSQGMHRQGVYPQYQHPQSKMQSNVTQQDPYQQGILQGYQYIQPPNNSNWHGENVSYPMGRQQSDGFHQILRAETNVPNSSDASHIVSTRQYQSTPHDVYRPPEPHRQMEAPHNLPPLEVGDAVQSSNNPVAYGTIKWIGELPGSKELIAGLEMEQPVVGATNGWHDGYQYFMCEPGKGMFMCLGALEWDDRLSDALSVTSNPFNVLSNLYKPITPHFVQAPEELNRALHIGIKGIQGHGNSCYLDATLYGMFAFSNTFDGLILESNPVDDFGLKTKNTLEQKIVNPLRKVHAVVQDAVLALQEELATLQKMRGLTSDERDPEEFLNLLFKHVLHVDPFMIINRPSGTDKEFFMQLFVGPDENVPMPDTYWLLHKTFKDENITFKECPQKMLLQIHGYGKHYSIQRVKPTLTLDVAVLCEGYAGPCHVCNSPGKKLCNDCSQLEFLKYNTPLYFCEGCSVLWHSHPDRGSHKPVTQSGTADTYPLELVSVICKGTSHYVCFTRITGSGKDEWVFFDSMATRTDDEYYLPRVTECTDEINEWVYGGKDTSKIPSKQLPELVRQYVEESYLCIYAELGGNLY